ncbi:hypothetical protein RDWZM_003506 [Blomia tropicalis]|uniref:Uncharacterized protein n=1 Tax=Blomia tropicalis TaxID=40697 RepID=A0A9Q0RSM3_BLOTA|nr:hypothetical protein RDWZM_003506 [Blomia tropicalis]
MDSLRKVHGKGIASDATTILRLYEDCLRAEEGIRYRRSGPSFMTMEQQHQDQNGQLDNFDSFNIQDDAKLSNKRILYRLKQLFNRL